MGRQVFKRRIQKDSKTKTKLYLATLQGFWTNFAPNKVSTYVRKSVHFKNTWLHDPNFFQNCCTFQYKISWLWFDLFCKVLQFWKKWESCIFLKWMDFTSSTFFLNWQIRIHVSTLATKSFLTFSTKDVLKRKKRN